MILVTGATGNVGRHVVAQLVEAGEKVRAIARNPGRAAFPDGVDVVRADLSDPSTLSDALAGVRRAFLFPVSGATEGFLARADDLERVVLLSSAAVTYDEPNEIALRHLEPERALAASGLQWTFVRPGAFMTNDLQWAPGVKAGTCPSASWTACSPCSPRSWARRRPCWPACATSRAGIRTPTPSGSRCGGRISSRRPARRSRAPRGR